MGKLEKEYEEWNTPVCGAYLIWQFAIGYKESNTDERNPNIFEILYAYVLLTSNKYKRKINGHRTNFASYIKSFTQDKESDLLTNFSNELFLKREFAMKSLDIAVSAGLLGWQVDNASLIPLCELKESKGSKTMGIDIISMGKNAKLLGKWFSTSDFITITNSLGVVL